MILKLKKFFLIKWQFFYDFKIEKKFFFNKMAIF